MNVNCRQDHLGLLSQIEWEMVCEPKPLSSTGRTPKDPLHPWSSLRDGKKHDPCVWELPWWSGGNLYLFHKFYKIISRLWSSLILQTMECPLWRAQGKSEPGSAMISLEKWLFNIVEGQIHSPSCFHLADNWICWEEQVIWGEQGNQMVFCGRKNQKVVIYFI